MDGVLLRIPKQTDPMELQPVIKQDKMFEAYKEHLTLQRTVGLDNVGDLNLAIEKGRSQDIILVSEAMQEKQVAKIAEKIADGYKEGIRIVLISGPSSSGKTTFCKRLQVQLTTNLLHPVGISLDDYFLNREDTPKDEAAPEEKTVDRKTVRAFLAEKSRAGKTSEVKNLIEQFGFQKLSDVPDEKLPELYEKAQVL